MTVLLHAGDEKKLHDCFNATVPSLMIGQWGSKHAGFDVLCDYCDSDALCAFFGLHCGPVHSCFTTIFSI